MSTTFLTTLPDGTQAKRTSKNRTYAFAVAAQKPAALVRREVVEAIAHTLGQYIPKLRADRARLVAGEVTARDGHKFLIRGETTEFAGARDRAEMIADYDRYLSDAQASVDARQAVLDADQFEDEPWFVTGWQSRRDLADKEVNRWLKNGWRVRLLEATTK